MESLFAYLRVNLCRDGLDQMRHDSEDRVRRVRAVSPSRATMLNAEGVASLDEGDLDTRRLDLRPRVRRGDGRGCGAARGDDPRRAGPHRHRSRSLVRSRHAGPRSAGRDRGRRPRRLLDQCARVRRRRPHRRPRRAARTCARLRAAHCALAPAPHVRPTEPFGAARCSSSPRVYAALDDSAGHGAVLREIRDIVQQRPRLGRLPERAEALRIQLDTPRVGVVGASSLTNAELRLAPHLPTHLTFPEIAERLHVSRHTVKSQAISIYQKLGVSSHADAIPTDAGARSPRTPKDPVRAAPRPMRAEPGTEPSQKCPSGIRTHMPLRAADFESARQPVTRW